MKVPVDAPGMDYGIEYVGTCADWSVRCHGVTTLTHEIPKTAENCLEQTQNDGRRGRVKTTSLTDSAMRSRTLRRHRQRVG